MKRTKMRRVIISLLISIIMLLVLSVEGQAATRIMDELVANTNKDITKTLGSEAGIYQTALSAYMDNPKTLHPDIAKSRTYYGKGENLKIRFSFSREISSYSGLELGIKFGNSEERKVTSYQKVGSSYVEFSYNIASDDNGGLTITYVKGNVTDGAGNIVPLGTQDKENMWKNEIIADTIFDEPTKSNGSMTFSEKVYKLDGNQIRNLSVNDIQILNTTNGTSRACTSSEVSISADGKTISPTNPNSIIFIKDVCDIAGNTQSLNNSTTDMWYLIDTNGVVAQSDGKYYFKAGKTIKFLRINCLLTDIKIDQSSRNLTFEKNIADGIDQYKYTIKAGDNGYITTPCPVGKNCNIPANEYIADTTAPSLTFKGIYLVKDTLGEKLGKAYYSDNANVNKKLDENAKETSGTIWANPETNFFVEIEMTDDNWNRDNWSFNDNDDNFSTNKYGDENTDVKKYRVIANKNGIADIEFFAEDYAGNIGKINIKDNFTLLCDTTGPRINIKPYTYFDGYGDSNGQTSSGSEYARSDRLVFLIEPEDPKIGNYLGSGVQNQIDKSKVIIANGQIMNETYSDNGEGNSYIVEVMPVSEGDVKVYVMPEATIDNVGNKSSASSLTKVYNDQTAPVINDITGVPTDWVEEATLSVIASDAGIGGIQYKFTFRGDDGTEKTQGYSSDNKFTVDKNGIVTIRVKDQFGNESEEKQVKINKIRTIAPVIKIENNGGNYVIPTGSTVAKVNPIVEVDSENNCTLYYGVSNSNTRAPESYASIKTNKSELSLDVSNGTSYLWTYAEDAYGTRSNTYVSNAFIVKNSTIQLTPNPTNDTNQDVTVNIQYGEGLTENRKVGIGNNETANTTSVTLSENGTVYAEATDKAGNKVYNSLNVTNIDKVAPVITIDVQKKEYVLSSSEETIKMDNKISITEENLKEVKYSWVKEDKEPTTWDNSFTTTQISAKSADVTKTATKEDAGVWYLYVKAIDKAGNETIAKTGELVVKPAISLDDIEKIGKLKVIDGVIYAIVPEKTKANDLLKYVVSPYDVAIKTADGKEVTNDSSLATNYRVTVDGIEAQCIIVVKGDVTGDGAVNMSDILKLNQARLKKIQLTTAEMLAGNVVDSDDSIDMRDILKLNQYRLKKINEL